MSRIVAVAVLLGLELLRNPSILNRFRVISSSRTLSSSRESQTWIGRRHSTTAGHGTHSSGCVEGSTLRRS